MHCVKRSNSIDFFWMNGKKDSHDASHTILAIVAPLLSQIVNVRQEKGNDMIVNTLSPCIATEKVEESREFYVKHFGAKVTFDCGWMDLRKLFLI
jgi:hypothetical protein